MSKQQYFEHIAEYGVAACRECRYAVWPEQIEGHLQEQHKTSRKEAEVVGQHVRSWAGLVQYPSELEVPGGIPKPVPQLPVQKRVHAQVDDAYARVYCQRLFGSRHGSQYFEVQPPSQEGEGAGTAPVDGDAAWARVGEAMERAWENVERRAQSTIQEGERDEVNPWVERTQWLPYLVGMEQADLMACIEEPVAEPDPRSNNEAEPVEAAIWAAMAELTRFSQTSAIERVGVFVRLEAIRTEKHQTRYQPLQPYMDKDAIVKHMRPWQQVL
ncbi:hypothetical protein CC86DRAFT_414286, partial [Ophiobolus disseminans]